MKGLTTTIIFFLLSIALALAIPTAPHLYYGDVTINNVSAPDNLVVTAKINDEEVGASVTKDGSYGYDTELRVDDPAGDREGETIDFFVDGNDAGISVIYTHATHETKVDIDVSGIEFCGDGSCNNGEDCSSCSSDCGQCSTPASTGGGGGGGGGSSTKRCTPSWICLRWSMCSIIEKQRCLQWFDQNQCNKEHEGSNQRNCTYIAPPETTETSEEPEEESGGISTLSTSEEEGGQSDIEESKTEQTKKSGFALITGAFLGTGDVSWNDFIIPISIIVVIVGGGLLVFVFYRKNKKQ